MSYSPWAQTVVLVSVNDRKAVCEAKKEVQESVPMAAPLSVSPATVAQVLGFLMIKDGLEYL